MVYVILSHIYLKKQYMYRQKKYSNNSFNISFWWLDLFVKRFFCKIISSSCSTATKSLFFDWKYKYKEECSRKILLTIRYKKSSLLFQMNLIKVFCLIESFSLSYLFHSSSLSLYTYKFLYLASLYSSSSFHSSQSIYYHTLVQLITQCNKTKLFYCY